MANFAGQGDAWAKAIRGSEHFDARNGQLTSPGVRSAYDADLSINYLLMRSSNKWAREQRRVLMTEYTHVMVEAARPILGRYQGGDTERQIRKLAESGLIVGLIWHGSDIRQPRVHAGRVKDSPFQPSVYEHTEALAKQSAKNAAMADRLGLPEFVSTPDLLNYRPQATWLPILVNEEVWNRVSAPAVKDNPRPRIIHIPSRAALKGTALARPILQQLHDEHIIEYVELSGVPFREMPGITRSADMMVDQFGMDAYGTAAIEAMSQGVPVIGQIGELTKSYVRERTGQEIPIADATADTLRETVIELASNPDKRIELANKGLDFLDRVHSPQNVRAVLSEEFLR